RHPWTVLRAERRGAGGRRGARRMGHAGTPGYHVPPAVGQQRLFHINKSYYYLISSRVYHSWYRRRNADTTASALSEEHGRWGDPDWHGRGAPSVASFDRRRPMSENGSGRIRTCGGFPHLVSNQAR